jgi:hypothetical protein
VGGRFGFRYQPLLLRDRIGVGWGPRSAGHVTPLSQRADASTGRYLKTLAKIMQHGSMDATSFRRPPCQLTSCFS